jgi:hypothetical protein
MDLYPEFVKLFNLNIVLEKYLMLIGLVGNKGVGKDTFADYLVKYYNFQKTHFADPLKEALRHIFDLSDNQLYGSEKEIFDKRWNKTPRELFQLFGTEIMRNTMSPLLGLADTIWVYRFTLWYEANKNNDKNIVCCDVRFENEAFEIKKLGGILIRIDDRNEKHDSHISECLIDKIKVDYTIQNTKVFEEYYNEIKQLMEKLTIKEM